MKKLIDLFNKKYGHIYGVIDDSIDNEDVFKAYKVIKTLCADDTEIMELLNRVKLPSPKTASESIDKIYAEHINGGGMTEDKDLATKKYVDDNMCNKNNINNFYKEPIELFNINLVTDENGHIVNTSDFDYIRLSTNGYGVGAYKNLPMTEEYEKYLTNIKNLIDVRLKSNDEVIYERLNSSAGGTIPVNIYYPASRDLPCIQFQVRTNYTYDTVNNKYIVSKGNMCVFIGIIRDEATQDSYVSTTINATVNLKETNSENISSFVTLKESEQGYGLVPTNHSSDIYTGKYTMNLNSKSAPSNSYVVGSNTFGNTQGEIECSGNLSVFGGNDILMISYGAIYGFQNSIKAHRSGAGMWGVSVFGNNITFNEAKDNKASYLLMCGDHLTATKSGAYIGRYATIPDTEIFAVCNGTSNEEKILLSVNRDTGAVTSISNPTEDTHLTTKKYVDDKTEILPVKNNYIIFEDAVPSRTEVASNGLEYYIFDSLQNEDMIISAVKYNLNVTFNDGTNDRTMDLIIERSLKNGVSCEKDGFVIEVIYIETNHAIEMVLINANDYTQYSILKATLNCDSYSNLLQDYHIENIDYDKIKGVPTALNRIANYKDFTLEGKEYYELYDNLSIWDANKFNERLDENSGVKRNEFFKLPGKDNYTMRIKQKDSEGIGFGQHISIDNSKNVHIVADAGVDVIIKIYNSTTKELIDTLNYCKAGFYMTRILNKGYLNGVTSIFIAFTVKDSTESFYGNTQVNDLIVHYDSSFLVKEEILTKTNTKEYIPTGDYNPATKKYVDEKIASIDTTINTLPVNGSLNLTTSKFQTTTLASDIEVILPTVEGYTEIHLFFLGISGTNVSDTNVAWNNKPTIEDNKKYEFIYTYVNSEIGWLGKAVVYTV